MSIDGLSGEIFANLKSAIDEAAILAITDRNGVITYVNKKFCEISKYSREELVGKTHKIVNSGFHGPEFFKEMWQTISQGKSWEGEIRNRAKDGTNYWVHTTIVPFLNDKSEPVRYVAVRYEITEQKMAHEQLKINTKKLEASNRELQDFASVAAHDLQEPLRKIQSFSDRLKIKAAAELSEEAVDYLNRIQSSAGRMQILINDLLTFSRVTTKAQPYVDIDLNLIIGDVSADLEAQRERMSGQIKWGNLPTIQADPTQMRQLFQNLISNGLKFAKPGTSPLIEISATTDKTNAQIRVKDNGIGFDEKYLDRIFTIFQRLHGRHEYEGTGIGLAVCRKIVDRHNGYITAESAVGKGSTFIVTLPIKQVTE